MGDGRSGEVSVLAGRDEFASSEDLLKVRLRVGYEVAGASSLALCLSSIEAWARCSEDLWQP